MHSPLVDKYFNNKVTFLFRHFRFLKTVKSHIPKNMLPSRIANK